MDAFENIVAGLLWEEGYWTHVGYKVNLSVKEKADLGKPSLPRPEIDIVAYRTGDNRLLWVECKSYLDSRGVTEDALTGVDARNAQRYKVFTWPAFREKITEALIKQLSEEKRILPNPTVQYCLVTGKIATDTDRSKLHKLFNENGWMLRDEPWIRQELEKLAKKGYENDIAIVVAKLFSRVKVG